MFQYLYKCGYVDMINTHFSNMCVTSFEGRSGKITAYFNEKNTSGGAKEKKAVDNYTA